MSENIPAGTPPEYRPNLARHRRQFEKYPNPVAWAVPLVVLALGVAAVLHMLPDIGLKPGEFARAYERVRRDDVKKRGVTADPAARATADSLAAVLKMPAGFPERLETAGARLLRASGTHVASGKQLHLVVLLPGAGATPVSVFAEHFVARDVDRYRRKDVGSGRLYFSSEPATKNVPADSVMVWQEIGVLATLIGSAPEDSLTAFGERMMALAKAAHAADLAE